MLNVIFQTSKAKDPSKVIVDSRFFFSKNKKKEWFADPFVQSIIQFVDKANVVGDYLLEDRDGNMIPPEYLSTGTKTAICIYEFPELIFNLTQMGDNVLIFIVKLSLQRDITAICYRYLPYCQLQNIDFYKDYKKFEIGDSIDFYDAMDEWLEEIMND